MTFPIIRLIYPAMRCFIIQIQLYRYCFAVSVHQQDITFAGPFSLYEHCQTRRSVTSDATSQTLAYILYTSLIFAIKQRFSLNFDILKYHRIKTIYIHCQNITFRNARNVTCELGSLEARRSHVTNARTNKCYIFWQCTYIVYLSFLNNGSGCEFKFYFFAKKHMLSI